MKTRSAFAGLAEFLAVAERSSFRLAAADLGVTPAAVSQSIRALETHLGVLLLQRTTRRVGLTEAGALLLSRLRPAAAEIGEALGALAALRERPSGVLRLSVPRIALALVIEPVLPVFRRDYPDVGLDIDVEDAAVDLTAGGFDVGIRIGEFVERDMIALRLTPDIQWSIVGSPGYFDTRGRPQVPEDLAGHECIRYRFPAGRNIYRWEFVREGRDFALDPRGGLIVNDGMLQIRLAIQGLGLTYTADLAVAAAINAGELETVLAPYLPSSPGLFLYFPTRSQTQPKLRAFIATILGTARRAWTSPRG